MSADNYLFVDQENLRVYHRFASEDYGGLRERFEREILGSEISEEQPDYEAESLEDAIRWCEEFGWTEYGITVGSLCPACRAQTDRSGEGEAPYPYCIHCGSVKQLREAIERSGGLSPDEKASAHKAVDALDYAAVLSASPAF